MEKRGVRRTLTLLIAGGLVIAMSGFAAGVVVGEVHSGGAVSKVYSSYAASSTATSLSGEFVDIPGLSVTVSVPGKWKHALLLVTFEIDKIPEPGRNSAEFRIAVDGVGVQDPVGTVIGGSWQRQAVAGPGTQTVSAQYSSGGAIATCSLLGASIQVLTSKS